MTTARTGFDWPNALVLVATIAAAGVVAASVASFASGRRELVPATLAAFLACFAVVKFAVAARAIRDARVAAGSSDDPRALHGSNGRFWLWVGMKALAAALALGAALVILIRGPGSLAG